MAYQDWVSLVNDGLQANAAGAVLNTAATATISPVGGTSAFGDGASVAGGALPGGWYPGMLVRYTARGFLTTVASSGTLTFTLAARLGNTGSTYVTLASSAALTTGTTVITGLQWELRGLSRCTAIASSGNTISTQGALYLATNVTAPTLVTPPVNVIKLPLPSASGETAAAVDTTQLQGLSLRCAQATSTCTVQLTQWLVEGLN